MLASTLVDKHVRTSYQELVIMFGLGLIRRSVQGSIGKPFRPPFHKIKQYHKPSLQ
jgi:hypothetical protein